MKADRASNPAPDRMQTHTPSANPDTLEIAPGHQREKLEGWIPSLATEMEIRHALEKAFDFRGDITITRKDGSKIEGYLFDRRSGLTLADSFVRIFEKASNQKVLISYADIGALAQEHVEDVVGGTVAEELAEGFFVIRDAVLFNQGDEVLRGEAGERGLGEVGVGGEEVFRLGVDVGEVAATAAGDENLFAGAVGVLEDEGVATAASSFDGAHEARSAGAKDEDVYFGHKVYCQRREARSYNGEASL